MKYGIAYFPSKQIQDEVNSYRKRYDSHYALIPPHLTLKEGFEADDETINNLITELKTIANETEPFNISLNKVSSFAPITNTIYMKINPSPELQTLYDKLHSGNFSTEADHPFVPHITLAQDLVDQEYSDVFGSLKMKSFDLADQVDRFQLLYQLDNGSWTVFESFVFGKEFI